MAFIRTIPKAKAAGELADAYRYAAETTGSKRVGKVIEVFSLAPDTLRAVVRRWELSMWIGTERRQGKEFLAAAVSRTLNCTY